MNKLAFILLILFSFDAFSQKESPYKLSLQMDIPIIAAGAGIGIASLILRKQVNSLTPAQLSAFNRNDVNKFDRSATYNLSHAANITSDVFLYGSGAIILSLLADKNVRKDYLAIGTMGLEAFILTAALTNLTKVLVKRPRPLTYNPNASLSKKTEGSSRLSFFSGHTSTAAVLTFFTAKILTDYHPDWRFKSLIWTSAAIIPALTGLMRYEAGKHYFTDVLAGYAVGALFGYLIPQLHKKKKKTEQLSVVPFYNNEAVGLSLTYRY